MRVNLKGVSSEGGFVLLPPGEHRVFLFDHENKQSQSGKDFVNCEFRVADGTHKGVTVFDKLFLTEASLWRLRQFADAVRYPAVDDADGFDTSDLFKFAQGVILVARVINEPYTAKDGTEKKANRVEAFRASEGATQTVATNEEGIPF